MFSPPQKPLNRSEFIILLAAIISIIALSIDIMLPALGPIAEDLNLANRNDAQLVITTMFLGFAAGQIIVGPLSDSFGRRPVIAGGFVVFMIGCLLSAVAENFFLMLAGRVLQGLGAAAPRIVSTAIIRDLYQGRQMARINSIIMAVFVLVPALAPAIGQIILSLTPVAAKQITPWRMLFVFLLIIGFALLVWFMARQRETLETADKRPFSLISIVAGFKEAMGDRPLVLCTLALGLISGAFIAYLALAQQVFQEVYRTGTHFPAYFATGALSVGMASVVNSALVMRFGMRLLSNLALIVQCGAALILLFVFWWSGPPSLTWFMIWQTITLFCMGLLFGNLTALALEGVGHIAGLAAAFTGAVSTFIALPLAYGIGAVFSDTPLPLFVGYALLGALSLITLRRLGPSPQTE